MIKTEQRIKKQESILEYTSTIAAATKRYRCTSYPISEDNHTAWVCFTSDKHHRKRNKKDSVKNNTVMAKKVFCLSHDQADIL